MANYQHISTLLQLRHQRAEVASAGVQRSEREQHAKANERCKPLHHCVPSLCSALPLPKFKLDAIAVKRIRVGPQSPAKNWKGTGTLNVEASSPEMLLRALVTI